LTDDSEIQEVAMTPEILEKMLKKIAKKVCHQIVLMHDSLQTYNPLEFSSGEDQEGIQVEEVKEEKLQEESPGNSLGKIITHISESDKQAIATKAQSESEKMREELKKLFVSRKIKIY
jgi:hypothetical protein